MLFKCCLPLHFFLNNERCFHYYGFIVLYCIVCRYMKVIWKTPTAISLTWPRHSRCSEGKARGIQMTQRDRPWGTSRGPSRSTLCRTTAHPILPKFWVTFLLQSLWKLSFECMLSRYTIPSLPLSLFLPSHLSLSLSTSLSNALSVISLCVGNGTTATGSQWKSEHILHTILYTGIQCDYNHLRSVAMMMFDVALYQRASACNFTLHLTVVI